MKILMLNNEYPPLGGGQGNANKYLYEEFKKYKDIKIDVVTSSTDKYKEEKSKLGTIYYLDIKKRGKNFHFQTSVELLRYSIKALSFAKKLIKKEKKHYDLIVAWSGVPAGYLAYRLKKKFGIPYIVLLRGSDVPFHEKKWYYLDKFIFSWLSPIIWRNAKKVIANSEDFRSEAYLTSKDKEIEVIQNGVDIDFFKPSENKTQTKKIIILSVGRLSKIKGYDYLVKAFAELKNKNIELWFVGDGPEKENLIVLSKEKNINNKVKFLGIKNKTELKEIYQKADIYCLTSLSEGMSNTVLEAMASGLPIITTNVGGTKELIKENGIIISLEKSNSLKDGLNKLITNKTTRITMGKNSRKTAEKMSWSTVAKKFLEVCR